MNPELDKYDADKPATVKFDVTVQEANLILTALAELPYRVADPVMRKLIQQAQAQQQ